MGYILAALAAYWLFSMYSTQSKSAAGGALDGQNGWVPMINPTPLTVAQLMPYTKVGTGVMFALTHPHPSGSAILPLTALASGNVVDYQEKDGKHFWTIQLTGVTFTDKLPDGTPVVMPKGVQLPAAGTKFALADNNFFGASPF